MDHTNGDFELLVHVFIAFAAIKEVLQELVGFWAGHSVVKVIEHFFLVLQLLILQLFTFDLWLIVVVWLEVLLEVALDHVLVGLKVIIIE